MLAIKFDEEKVKCCIQAYKDEHGKNPYLVMNEKTRAILPPTPPTTYCISTDEIMIGRQENLVNTITINDKKYISEEEAKKGSGNWFGCKIMIDNDLEFGEIHIG